MSTTNSTTGSNQSTLQFNPISQGIYNQLVSGGGNVLSGYINSPFSNPMYNMGASQSQKGAQQAGANNMGALNQNQLTSGLTGQAGAGWLAAQKASMGRANQSMSSQANIQNIMSALTRQMQATGMGMSFSPQLTGQKGTTQQTQTTSGLGTWLPQLLGAGLSAATAGMSAGAGGGGFGSVGGASNPGLGSPSFMPGGGGAPSFGSMFSGFNPSSMLSGMSMPTPNPMMPSYGGQ